MFAQADVVLSNCAREVREIVDRAWSIDEKLFSPGKKDAFVDSQRSPTPNIWPPEEQPPPKMGRFVVTVDRRIEVGDGKILTGNEEYEVTKAEGDIWTVKDRLGKEWKCPAEATVPIPK